MPVRVSEAEEARIERAIQAAISGSWNEFVKLTDAPFSNDASMMEQFADSSHRLREVGGNWKMSSGVGIAPEGTRLITARIEAPPTVDIVLCLHSTSYKDDSTISIWTFHQQLNWD
ncbi:hypothetical protein NKH85_19265 [Mesorhizobium sp. M0924]|uniref:hypothetical protein n=1 Tax=unclassified Mesorhizobium TaxID=325217 RepID=UPI0003D01ACE|nr:MULTISPECIES: hypothetical protein [unclassified Mesorhizobium]ESZ57511.1 hypothetical protein X728_23760 [Mesorhizobium sp. L103C120A0]WJI43289.1 hypothetical protein NL532_21945 [Mesorhizobium sp. C120A]